MSPLKFPGLRRTLAVAIAEIEPSGRLHDANLGFLRLLPDAVAREPHPDVSGYLLSPSLPHLVECSQSEPHAAYEGLLTIGDPEGRVRTLRGAVSRSGSRLLLVTETEIEELERINDRAIQLSLDLAQAQRELLSAHNKLERREEEIRILSQTDLLTGIADHRRFDELIAAEFARVRRYGGSFALAVADIDHFKSVNDEFGHDVGDAALRAFANVVRLRIRRTDLAARFGGEEFIVLMPESDSEGAVRCAEGVRSHFAREPIPPIPWAITASSGVAVLHPDDTVKTLCKRADAALYAAKDGRRNRVVLA
nr:GGDEF domain-containing protein [Paludisphaera mucosa]